MTTARTQKRYARYYKLFQNVNDPVYTVNMQGFFTSLNAKGAKLLGYTQKEILTKNFRDIVAPEYLEIVFNKIKEKLNKNQATVYEIEIIKKGGARMPVEINSIIIFEGDRPVEILGVARDLTQRVQNMLFTSMAAHELKNPLTSLNLYAQMLQKGLQKLDQDKLLSYADAIKLQSDRLLDLINDLLEVSRLQSGKFSMQLTQIPIDPIIDEVIKLYSQPNSTHHILKQGASKLTTHADRTRIFQVLANLVSNAIKYSPQHNQVIINTEATDKDVIISVQNFGPPISAEEQKHLFNPFYRSKQTWQKNIPGHGLGLVICKIIIESHGGRIWVDSKKSHGVTFSFTLPK